MSMSLNQEFTPLKIIAICSTFHHYDDIYVNVYDH